MPSTLERIFLHTEAEALLLPPPDTSTSTYEDVAPSPALSGYVERIYLGHEQIPRETPIEERVLPDGSVHLLFNLGDRPTELSGAEGSISEALGVRCEPALIRMVGSVEQVGVRLRPGGLAPLLGVPAGELAGRNVSLYDLWGARAKEALERLSAAPRGRARVEVMESVLLEILGQSAPRPHAGAANAVKLIAETGGQIRVRELAAALGVGERRLEQIFHCHVGLSPKAACRLMRFRALVSLLRPGSAHSWSQLAHQCGFYDQSHLINELQALAGLTPRAFEERLGFGFFQDEGVTPR